jgi:hypothetical protein
MLRVLFSVIRATFMGEKNQKQSNDELTSELQEAGLR